MKTRHRPFLSLILILLCTASACKTGSQNANSAATQTNAKSEQTTPTIETTPEALSKEWLANPAETEGKYKDKTLSLTGDVDVAYQIENQVFIVFMLGTKITCVTTPSSETQLLIKAIEANQRMMKETNQKDLKMPKQKVTVKGIYLRSAPPDQPSSGFIDLKPCELILK